MRKTYRSATRLTFPLELKGGKRHVKFEEKNYGYSTSDAEEQEVIESSPHFKRGEIKLFNTVAEEGDKTTKKPVANPPAPKKEEVVDPTKVEEDLDDKNVDLNTLDRAQLLDFINMNDIAVVVTDEMYEEDICNAIAAELEGNADADVKGDDGVTDYPKVTDINGAVEVLKGEPYKVAHQSLRTPTAILNKAAEHKVTFSNWKVD